MFLCYEYLDDFKQDPPNYDRLFTYLRYKQTKSKMRRMAAEQAKALSGASNEQQ